MERVKSPIISPMSSHRSRIWVDILFKDYNGEVFLREMKFTIENLPNVEHCNCEQDTNLEGVGKLDRDV